MHDPLLIAHLSSMPISARLLTKTIGRVPKVPPKSNQLLMNLRAAHTITPNAQRTIERSYLLRLAPKRLFKFARRRSKRTALSAFPEHQAAFRSRDLPPLHQLLLQPVGNGSYCCMRERGRVGTPLFFSGLIDGISGCFLSDWDVNVHLLVNVNVPEKMTSRSLTIA